MSNFLELPNEELPPIEDLLKLALVAQADIEEAITAWEANPPDEEFQNILRASVEDVI
ncbi:MAG: hypothetical protein WBB28_09435 [Crinalium sp.]